MISAVGWPGCQNFAYGPIVDPSVAMERSGLALGSSRLGFLI